MIAITNQMTSATYDYADFFCVLVYNEKTEV
jgi:hypothetical protein